MIIDMNFRFVPITLLCLLLISITACDTLTSPIGSEAIATSSPLPAPTNTIPPTNTAVAVDPSGIARAFVRAWEGQDYLGMYSLLSPQSQALVGSQAFVDRYTDAMNTATVQSIHAQPLSLNQEETQASFAVRMTMETALVGNIIRDITIPLIYNENRWGVIWDEGLILPELAGGYRLAMDYRVPARANIYDINGRALAYQGSLVSLGVIPGQIEDETSLLTLLSRILNQPAEEIQERYASYQPDWYAPIGDITEEEMQTYAAELQPYFGAGLAPPTTRLTRLYTPEGIGAHIVGYAGPVPADNFASYQQQGYRENDITGLAGLEKWGEPYLRGERGGVLTVVTSTGDYVSTIQEKESRQARSIYTTVERDFQWAVEQALAQAILTHPIARLGSAVVMDVNTGDIYALASYPSYNPIILDPTRTATTAQLNNLLNDPNNPLVNRVTQGGYPAGSVFKLVTFTAGLQSGLYTAETRYTSTGTWDGLGENFIKRDWRDEGHGTVSMSQALIVSCNSCFYEMGLRVNEVNPNLLPNTAQTFGLGQPTGIEGLAETAGLIPSPEWKINTVGEGWAPGDAVNMAIGGGYVQVSPLQMVDMIAAIANGGTLYQPRIVNHIGAGGGAPEETLPIQTRGELPLSASSLATIQNSLWQVANNEDLGTAAHQFVGLPVIVAGKTGTAEAPPRNPHAWFAGYAPAAPYTKADGTLVDSPEIAIVVMIENAGEGSDVAAPIFRRLVELYYDLTPTPFPW